MISIVVPVYNEEKILEDNILKLFEFFKNPPHPPFVKGGTAGEFQIIISDNASTDKTPEIAKRLAEKFSEINPPTNSVAKILKNDPSENEVDLHLTSSDKQKSLNRIGGGVKYLRLEKMGKGLAIAEGWRRFPAQPPLPPEADPCPQRLPANISEVVAGCRRAPLAETPPISPGAKQGENAGVYMFLDADLSCDLNDIPKFIEAINPSYKIPLNPPLSKGGEEGDLKMGGECGGYDIACGSRHLKNSKDNRPLVRRLISKTWNLIPKILFRTKLTDTACGIKAVSQRVIDEILPKVKNREWFFDTELLLRAENFLPPPLPSPSPPEADPPREERGRGGVGVAFSQREGEERWGRYKIKEIPITWTEHENRKSKVNFFKVGAEYIKSLLRLKSEIYPF